MKTSELISLLADTIKWNGDQNVAIMVDGTFRPVVELYANDQYLYLEGYEPKKQSEIESYFNACVEYWMFTVGDSREVATCKAIWWDCVGQWNRNKSWNDGMIAFINKLRKYTPYSPTPNDDDVASGNA